MLGKPIVGSNKNKSTQKNSKDYFSASHLLAGIANLKFIIKINFFILIYYKLLWIVQLTRRF